MARSDESARCDTCGDPRVPAWRPGTMCEACVVDWHREPHAEALTAINSRRADNGLQPLAALVRLPTPDWGDSN